MLKRSRKCRCAARQKKLNFFNFFSREESQYIVTRKCGCRSIFQIFVWRNTSGLHLFASSYSFVSYQFLCTANCYKVEKKPADLNIQQVKLVWTPEALSPIKHSNPSLLMIELSNLDGLNDVEIYSALKIYLLLWSIFQSNNSILKNKENIINNLLPCFQ